jgi:hypothetical protein
MTRGRMIVTIMTTRENKLKIKANLTAIRRGKTPRRKRRPGTQGLWGAGRFFQGDGAN